MFPLRALLAFLLVIILSPFAFADGPPRVPSEGDVVLVGAPAETVVALDAGPESAPAAELAPLPPGTDPTDDVGALAALAIQAVRTGNWWALAALALSVVVSLARKFLGKSLPFLATDRGGFLTVVLLAFFGAVATALLGGKPIGLDLAMDAMKVALTAAGGFVGFKKVFMDSAKIEAAGASAAAKPTAGAAGVVGASKPLGR